MNCRYCKKELKIKFLDLGLSPLANNYLSKKDLKRREKFYPLKTWFCNSCYLVQSQGFNKINLLFNSRYTYFSSVSKSFSKHFKDYVVKTYSQTACAAINTTIDKIHQLRQQLDFKKFNTL